jgi:hypothetical protein
VPNMAVFCSSRTLLLLLLLLLAPLLFAFFVWRIYSFAYIDFVCVKFIGHNCKVPAQFFLTLKECLSCTFYEY